MKQHSAAIRRRASSRVISDHSQHTLAEASPGPFRYPNKKPSGQAAYVIPAFCPWQD